MDKRSYYVLVSGKFYQGDIEGKRYHWTKGIPGSKQLVRDLEVGTLVSFVYYRTLDRKTKRGKYFYGTGIFDNNSLEKSESPSGKIECFARITNYTTFSVPVTVEKFLRKKIWAGANRQPGIKKISDAIFTQTVKSGLHPDHINDLTSMLGERDVEALLNNQITPSDIKDPEGHKASKRAVHTEVYKRSQKTIRKLKKKYKGLCQITGEILNSSRNYGVDVTEAHHIDYLSRGGLDCDSSNIIIISPEWHRLLHKENPKFDRERLAFVFRNEKILPIGYAGHLR